jgi:hypothetical protein
VKSIAAPSVSNVAARVVARLVAFERRFKGVESKVRSSGSFLDASRADAFRTNAHVLSRAVHERADAPQIRIPAAPARIIRVTDHVAKVRHLAAQLTLHRHIHSLLVPKNVPNASFSFYQTLRRFAHDDGVLLAKLDLFPTGNVSPGS